MDHLTHSFTTFLCSLFCSSHSCMLWVFKNCSFQCEPFKWATSENTLCYADGEEIHSLGAHCYPSEQKGFSCFEIVPISSTHAKASPRALWSHLTQLISVPKFALMLSVLCIKATKPLKRRKIYRICTACVALEYHPPRYIIDAAGEFYFGYGHCLLGLVDTVYVCMAGNIIGLLYYVLEILLI